MKNKGFSLVELIIVIAIMAILAAAIAPALIRYIDKSRRSDDVAAAETVNTAAQAALANEDAYDGVQQLGSGVQIVGYAKIDDSWTSYAGVAAGSAETFLEEVQSSTGGGPSIKYKKNSVKSWTVGVDNSTGKPVVWLSTGATGGTQTELQPTIDKSYK